MLFETLDNMVGVCSDVLSGKRKNFTRWRLQLSRQVRHEKVRATRSDADPPPYVHRIGIQALHYAPHQVFFGSFLSRELSEGWVVSVLSVTFGFLFMAIVMVTIEQLAHEYSDAKIKEFKRWNKLGSAAIYLETAHVSLIHSLIFACLGFCFYLYGQI